MAAKPHGRRDSQTLPGPTHVPHLEHPGQDQIGGPQECARPQFNPAQSTPYVLRNQKVKGQVCEMTVTVSVASPQTQNLE